MSEHSLSHPMNPNQGMAESLGEQLSALMDGELAGDQVRFLLRGVEAQPDLLRRWSNYQVISASLKREYVAVALPVDFADSVIGRLDAEIPIVAVRSGRRVGFGALRWVGGGAIAAAVAVVALTVSRPIDNAGGPAVAMTDQASVRHSSAQPYLPLAVPLPNTNSPLFSSDAAQPVSFDQVVPNYYPSVSDVRIVVPRQFLGYRAPLLEQERKQEAPQAAPQAAAPAQQ